MITEKDITKFYEKSLSPQSAEVVLFSSILVDGFPQIERVFEVPMPIINNNKLTFIKKGYDERFNSYLNPNCPTINEDMSLEKAKEIIDKIFSEFCFKSEQDKINAIAGLLTPFIKSLLSEFNVRTPVFFYIANRERAGKDFLALITGILYEINAIEYSPISTGGVNGNNSEELRKKITTALISGKKSMHFSNNTGHLNNPVFEGVATASFISDRLLGENKLAELPNELTFSLSGNQGITYTPDFANRCVFVNLFLDIENANERKFKNPNLHEFVKNNRGEILSALFCFIKNWFDKGMPEGSIPFASYPEWSRICGGIIETAGYGNPCVLDKESLGNAGDSETQDMKELFELCFERFTDRPVKKTDIVNLIRDEEMFGYLDFESRKGQIHFGLKLRKFVGRILSDIRLLILDDRIKTIRQEYIFKKEVKVDFEEALK